MEEFIEHQVDQNKERPSLVVVGNGMVGHHFIKKLKSAGLMKVYDVSIFGAEVDPAYDRVSLSSYMTRVSKEDLTLIGPGDYDGITVILGDEVIEIDRTSKKISSCCGRKVSYDILVLACGSVPYVPQIANSDLKRCHVYRTFKDIEDIRASALGASHAVVAGAGLLGLEAAGALRELGLDVELVEFADRPLPLQIDAGGGTILRRYLEEMKLGLHFSVGISSINADNDEGVKSVTLSDGSELNADLVVFATGVRPSDKLAREAGLDIGPRGGIAVDGHCQSSDPSIFAIGECASANGIVYGLVAPGYSMAETVVQHLAGEKVHFANGDTSAKLKLLGVEVASFGDAFGMTEGCLDATYMDNFAKTYKKLILSGDAKKLLGGILVGDVSSYGIMRTICSSSTELDFEVESLLVSQSSETVALGVMDPKATICSCNNVSVGELRSCIIDGENWDLGSIKSKSGAGTGCGSCVGFVKSLLDQELANAGKEVSRGLCEHFSCSRQELYDLVRAKGIRTFHELIAKHGQGGGCDICKPTVASILASCHGAHPLEGELSSLQDTNDHVLANLQKDGSYSVVPRIPGGEITPAGLIAIGEIASEFNLYTKITGAQRIDMFGAHLEDLPKIWRRLVDEGFESGHAYGKALRTVKSCVGSTWCRYGVQDSVALAIELELRYRGLRSPHKVKAGVSGCARECAEAKGKDVGVIATERGWNLYVGGNGGFTPHHAELLACDLDHDTLISYIDRYLMYYIRTADRLQRTSSWLENLDGGINHLKDVIINDSLGLCEELELAMKRHVENYSDEWHDALADPEILARFTTFVNEPGRKDPSITFMPERSQCRPNISMKIPQKLDISQRKASQRQLNSQKTWTPVCNYDDITPNRPVAALINGEQIALVKTSLGKIYALDNKDPFSRANVIARGLVGTKNGYEVIISPMYKQAFDLETGKCLDDSNIEIETKRARVRSGRIEVAL